jgi:hypothetical protein
MDLQLVAVIVLVVLAALYSVRRFLRQFVRPDDEAPACAGCPAAKPDLCDPTADEKRAPSSASPPGDGPRH